MVIISNGQSEITAQIATVFSTGQWGTDDTLESTSDTGLGAPIGDSDNSVTVQTTGQTIQTVHNLGVLESNGSTLVEFANKSATGTITRSTTVPIEKDNTKRVVTTSTFYITYS